MTVEYVHLTPEDATPALSHHPFPAVIITEADASDKWRGHVTEWLVRSGCLFAVAWGQDFKKWHDSVDDANLRESDFGDIPEDRFVITTWHQKESLEEALWFAGQCAFHPTVTLKNTIIVDVSAKPREAAMLKAYGESQKLSRDK